MRISQALLLQFWTIWHRKNKGHFGFLLSTSQNSKLIFCDILNNIWQKCTAESTFVHTVNCNTFKMWWGWEPSLFFPHMHDWKITHNQMGAWKWLSWHKIVRQLDNRQFLPDKEDFFQRMLVSSQFENSPHLMLSVTKPNPVKASAQSGSLHPQPPSESTQIC